MRSKKTVVFDFDGVIHSYTSGWKGVDVIPDPPVSGIREALTEIKEDYKVVIVSSRTSSLEGKNAVEQYMKRYCLPYDDITDTKPPAIVYIDDRAICFDGKPENLKASIDKFKTWMQK